ncbi:MAG TPA: hypothetical protein VFW60_01535 [Rhodanobacteraceae bacterium]|nr:hypothetical protein [Rhodanobacteraceae bacterium]
MPTGLPRIALVFGDAAATVHVREAMAGHADIVYAASADEFDVSRLTSARAETVLVNLDGGDWLDDVQASLDAAGVAMVFNDPEISNTLESWARARWLRHLVAKLSGSSDVDPPRPDPASQAARAAEPVVEVAQEISAPSADRIAAERPLSPEEIETMTADFVAEQEAASMPPIPSMAAPEADAVAVTPDAAAQPGIRTGAEAESVAAAVSGITASTAETAAEVESTAADFDPDGALDVDTEALSAMIDAKLADTDATSPSDSPQVWRVVSGGTVSPVNLEMSAGEGPAATQAAPVVESAAPTVTADEDDSDVLASLPSLDDWQLVDGDSVPVVAQAKRAPAELSLDAFAGLELVPMETRTPLETSTDPIESWLYSSESDKPKADAGHAAGTGAKEARRGHG